MYTSIFTETKPALENLVLFQLRPCQVYCIVNLGSEETSEEKNEREKILKIIQYFPVAYR